MGIELSKLEKKLGLPLIYFREIDSTSLYCKNAIKNGLISECAVFADGQLNGQGRLGKSFYSPKGSGLYITFSLKRSRFSQKNLTAAIALAVASAIETVFQVSCGVKWVNDVYLNGRKVAGVLCQSVLDYYLVGVGINVSKPEMIPDDLLNRLGWITERFQDVDKENLILSLYEQINHYCNFDDYGLLCEYRTRCVHIGSSVKILQDNYELLGKCIGIGDDFSLLVEIDGAIQSFSSGYMTLVI